MDKQVNKVFGKYDFALDKIISSLKLWIKFHKLFK